MYKSQADNIYCVWNGEQHSNKRLSSNNMKRAAKCNGLIAEKWNIVRMEQANAEYYERKRRRKRKKYKPTWTELLIKCINVCLFFVYFAGRDMGTRLCVIKYTYQYDYSCRSTRESDFLKQTTQKEKRKT